MPHCKIILFNHIPSRFLGKGHFTTGLTNSLVNQFESADYYKLPFGCTWTHIGGKFHKRAHHGYE